MKEKIDQNISKIVAIEKTPSGITAKFEVGHNNGVTTVTQNMSLEKVNGEWQASVKIDGMPSFEAPTEAAYKLADWLERLAKGIRSRKDYDKFDLNEL